MRVSLGVSLCHVTVLTAVSVLCLQPVWLMPRLAQSVVEGSDLGQPSASVRQLQTLVGSEVAEEVD